VRLGRNRMHAIRCARATGNYRETSKFRLQAGAPRELLHNSVVPYQTSDGKAE